MAMWPTRRADIGYDLLLAGVNYGINQFSINSFARSKYKETADSSGCFF